MKETFNQISTLARQATVNIPALVANTLSLGVLISIIIGILCGTYTDVPNMFKIFAIVVAVILFVLVIILTVAFYRNLKTIRELIKELESDLRYV